MAKKSNREKIRDLFKLITDLEDIRDCEKLFEDLCTKKEVQNMADRVYAAKLLLAGKKYTEVIEETKISSATLSRISQCVQYGSGYSNLLREAVESEGYTVAVPLAEDDYEEEEFEEITPPAPIRKPNFIEWD